MTPHTAYADDDMDLERLCTSLVELCGMAREAADKEEYERSRAGEDYRYAGPAPSQYEVSPTTDPPYADWDLGNTVRAGMSDTGYATEYAGYGPGYYTAHGPDGRFTGGTPGNSAEDFWDRRDREDYHCHAGQYDHCGPGGFPPEIPHAAADDQLIMGCRYMADRLAYCRGLL